MWREARVTKIVKFLFYFPKQTLQVSKLGMSVLKNKTVFQ